MRFVKYQNKLLALTTISSLLVLASCDNTEVQVGQSNVIGVSSDSGSSSSQPPSSNTVCDPFSGSGGIQTGLSHGVFADLKFLDDTQPHYTTVGDYQTYGNVVNANLFFSKIDVPTRKFDRGFVDQDGNTLLNQNGNTLYEYFSLRFQSVVRLFGADRPGNYQFAVLADDGAVLQIDDGSGFRTLVNNDGTHPSKLVCASAPVYFDGSTRLPIKIDYYQGPRYHISLILLWREWTGSASDPACGMSGNSTFFDFNNVPSTPTTTWTNLLSRGWKVLSPENYELPATIANNPCATESTLTTQFTNIVPSGDFTNQSSVSFEFEASEDGATFRCSLDGASPSDCTSPASYSALSSGQHQFFVQAIKDGLVDSVGAVHVWTIDTIAPNVLSIQTDLQSTSATIIWTTDKATTTTLNWGLGTATNNTVPESTEYSTDHSVTITGLAPNTVYSYVLGGKDQAGNLVVLPRRVFRTTP
ncbi:MAG: fibronectin type III domain-containing protein [Bacteriovoracia bacterium]